MSVLLKKNNLSRAIQYLMLLGSADLLMIDAHAAATASTTLTAPTSAPAPTVVTASTQVITALPTITLTATEQPNRKASSLNSSATKLNLPLKQTPQSVSVITAQQLQDQQINSFAEAIEQVPGVYLRRYGSAGALGVGGEYSSFYARGSEIKNISLDGLATTAAVMGQTGLNLSRLDPAIYEQISVVKGATGLSSGAGYPSASIDLKRKRADAMLPTGRYQLSANQFETRWGGLRHNLDLQAPLNADKTLRARTVLSFQDQNAFMRWGESQSGLLYSTVAIDPNPETQLNLGAMLQRNRSNGLSVHSSTLFANGHNAPMQPRDNAAPRWTYQHSDTQNAFVDATHQFDNGWLLKLNYNYLKQDSDGVWAGIANRAETADYIHHRGKVAAGSKQLSAESHAVDGYASRDYALLGQQHELILGASFQSFNSDNRYSHTIGREWVDLNSWNGEISKPADLMSSKRSETQTDSRQYALMAATRLNLSEQLHSILGLRNSGYALDSTRNGKPDQAYSDHNILTPYAGVVFDLNPYLSAYASYSQIFLPQSAKDQQEKRLDPIEGTSHEFGLKASLHEDALQLSAAYFQSRLDNNPQLVGILNNGENYYRAVKGAKTSGFELEAVGQLTPALRIQAGYTHATTKDQGKRIQLEQPQKMLKLHALYQLPAAWQQWQVGAGLRWQSQINDANVRGAEYLAHQQAAFSVVDLMLKYQLHPDILLGLDIKNVSNQKYRLNVLQATYADPRQYLFSMQYRF